MYSIHVAMCLLWKSETSQHSTVSTSPHEYSTQQHPSILRLQWLVTCKDFQLPEDGSIQVAETCRSNLNNNNKLINKKLICAFRWSVLSSVMKMHVPKNKIIPKTFNHLNLHGSKTADSIPASIQLNFRQFHKT